MNEFTQGEKVRIKTSRLNIESNYFTINNIKSNTMTFKTTKTNEFKSKPPIWDASKDFTEKDAALMNYRRLQSEHVEWNNRKVKKNWWN